MTDSKSTAPTGERTQLKIELIAGLSTYLTLSYIFILNPILLARAGIDPSQAFAATILSAAAATLLMGLWARLPFAVASAPSITTFFVSYVVLSMGLSWQAALIAVIVSGFISMGMTALSLRGKIVAAIPNGLRTGLLFSISGFLIANGLTQAKIVNFSSGFMGLGVAGPSAGILAGIFVFSVGLVTTLLLQTKALRFSGAPLVGILTATLVCISLGITTTTNVSFSWNMLGVPAELINWLRISDIAHVITWEFAFAAFIFFVIDFFSGVGKFVGLFTAAGVETARDEEGKFGKALYVDGAGTVVGGVLGGASLAVFISSAVGVAAGGRSGVTAVTIAFLILLSFAFIPLVGAIPAEAVSGILAYVALLLPVVALRRSEIALTRFDIIVCGAAFTISLLTYAIDRSMLLLFVCYTAREVFAGDKRASPILVITTLLLGFAVLFQAFVG